MIKLLLPLAGLALMPVKASESWSFSRLRELGFAELAAIHPTGPLLRASDGAFYGAASRGLYRLESDGSGFRVRPLSPAAAAQGQVLLATFWEGPNGRFYGASQSGRSAGVLAFQRDGSGLQLLHHFAEPNAFWTVGEHLVVRADGSVFGEAWRNGQSNRAFVFRIAPDGTRHDLHDLPAQPQGHSPITGIHRGVTTDAGGAIFGVVPFGGAAGSGVAFRLQPDGSGYTVLHEFGRGDTAVKTPVGPLCLASDGNFYGLASAAFLATNLGAVYRLTPTGGVAAVHYLSRGPDQPLAVGALMEGSDGRLYGTAFEDAAGIFSKIYRLHKDGSGFEIIYTSIAVSVGIATLTEGADGRFYTTSFAGPTDGQRRGKGSIFRVNRDGSGFTNLWLFHPTGGDGERPVGPLLVGSDGALYGTTTEGGAHDHGTVFRVNRDGSAPQVLHSFGGADAGGTDPFDGLIEGRDGQLYGVTAFGELNNRGTVFRIGKDGSNFTVLHHFAATANGTGDGANPLARLTQGSDGTLYGTTMNGGTNGSSGTVFRLNPEGTDYRVLHDFGPASHGVNPAAPLLLAQDGQLYGTTAFGGPANAGTVFALRSDGSGFRVLRTFTTNAGAAFRPLGGLIEGADGMLYGTALGGLGFGVVYSINRDGSGYAVRHSFTGGASGRVPDGGLALAPDGGLVGVVNANPPGGTNNSAGLLFRLDPSETNFAVLVSFAAGRGFFQPGQLAVGPDAAFYGADQNTGEFAAGLVFRLTPPDYQPRFVAGSARRLPSGELSAQILGALGQSVVVEASPDLRQWKSVAALVLTGSPVDFTSQPEVAASAQFYRVQVR